MRVFTFPGHLYSSILETRSDTRRMKAPYKLETTWSLLHPRASTLRLDVNVPALQLPSTVVGTLYWREKAIEVYGRKKPLSVIRHSSKDLMRRKRAWVWEGVTYTVEYVENGIKITSEGDSERSYPVAHLSAKEDGCDATITFCSDVPNTESQEIFLILVFVYSEHHRLMRNKSMVTGVLRALNKQLQCGHQKGIYVF